MGTALTAEMHSFIPKSLFRHIFSPEFIPEITIVSH
jgi:hypothetical protein